MSRHRRNAALATALATAATASLSALGVGGGHPVAGSENHAAPPQAGPDSEAPTTEVVPDSVDARPVDARLARRADRTARTFVAAFLRYEVGRLTQTDRQVLPTLSTPDLAASLLDTPPRLAQAPPLQAQIASAELLGADDTTAEVALRVARPHAGTSTIIVALTFAGTRAVVTGLR